jgi:hypothetical protein
MSSEQQPGVSSAIPQTTIEVSCTRCGGLRWIPFPFVALDPKGRPVGPPSNLREPDGYLCLLCRAIPADEWAAHQDARQDAVQKRLETRRVNASSVSPGVPGVAQTSEEGA